MISSRPAYVYLKGQADRGCPSIKPVQELFFPSIRHSKYSIEERTRHVWDKHFRRCTCSLPIDVHRMFDTIPIPICVFRSKKSTNTCHDHGMYPAQRRPGDSAWIQRGLNGMQSAGSPLGACEATLLKFAEGCEKIDHPLRVLSSISSTNALPSHEPRPISRYIKNRSRFAALIGHSRVPFIS